MDYELERNIKKNNLIVKELESLFSDSIVFEDDFGFLEFYIKIKDNYISIAIDLSEYSNDKIEYMLLIIDDVQDLTSYDPENILTSEYTTEFLDCVSWIKNTLKNGITGVV